MRFFFRWPLSCLTLFGTLCFAAGFYLSPPVYVIMVQPRSTPPLVTSPDILFDTFEHGVNNGDLRMEFLIIPIPVDPAFPPMDGQDIGPILLMPEQHPEAMLEI